MFAPDFLSDLPTACAAVCTSQVYITYSLFSLIFVVIMAVLLFYGKRFSVRKMFLFQLILIILFLSTFIAHKQGGGCGSGCDPNFIEFHFQILPFINESGDFFST